jgi:hypothetical protein
MLLSIYMISQKKASCLLLVAIICSSCSRVCLPGREGSLSWARRMAVLGLEEVRLGLGR